MRETSANYENSQAQDSILKHCSSDREIASKSHSTGVVYKKNNSQYLLNTF